MKLDLTPEEIGRVCLVTGGSGYLARFLVPRLVALGCEVRTLDLLPYPGRESVDARIGDVRLLGDVQSAARGVDTVFHTAAIINLLARYRRAVRRRVFDVNVVGTENLIGACEQEGVARLVYTSTINVAMGEPVRDGDESQRYVQPGDLLDLYAESKAEAEKLVLAANHASGLGTVALRLGGLWGAGEGAVMVTGFLEQLAAGRLLALVGDGTSVIDNTYVENAVDAHLLAAAGLLAAPERVGGQAYFITDDEPMNGVEWFRPLAEGLGHRWPSRRIPGWLMYRIAHLLEWVHYLGGPEPSLTRRSIQNLIYDSSFCIDKARRDLGYTPRVQSATGMPGILPQVKQLYDRLAGTRS